jgi:NADP-dependent aldehyde dehydrogenase
MTNELRVLIDGQWREADAASVFQAEDPSTGNRIDRVVPVSRWSDCDAALSAATKAAHELEQVPSEKIADFLDGYAASIDLNWKAPVYLAHEETGLPSKPRLAEVELPRTSDQLRQAAAAARERSWRRVTVDRQRNLRSCLGPIGPVVIFGPNNFPFAYNAVCGGDFAAAIAAANPVIAKAHPLHPGTSLMLATMALPVIKKLNLPPAMVQMIYHLEPETGLRLVSDPRVGAVAFTGSKAAGLALKEAADKAGRPIYLEMSSLNPVVFLPEGMKENTQKWATELADSCTAGSGQFCTRPNLVFMIAGPASEPFLGQLAAAFKTREPHTMLARLVRDHLNHSIAALHKAGAEIVTGGKNIDGPGYRHENTLLRVTGKTFLSAPGEFQREAFGNEVLAVTVANDQELLEVLNHLEGNLTASIYSSTTGADEELYNRLAPLLRRKSGRLLNDKMPTGVAVSPAMNHGGPYPSTGHPGWTAVGIPAAITRFTALQCYDNVREERLPPCLREA